ncbi:cell adhesion molecule CEACAM6-like isoform 12-T12 [Hipposideros larvatus]
MAWTRTPQACACPNKLCVSVCDCVFACIGVSVGRGVTAEAGRVLSSYREQKCRQKVTGKEGRGTVKGRVPAPSPRDQRSLLPQGGGSTHWEEEQQIPHVGTAVLGSVSGAQALLTEGTTEKRADPMEHPSASARRGRVRWQGFLLAVLLLTFWSPPTTARLTLELMPPNAVERKDVLFLVHNQNQDLLRYAWYKGERGDPKRYIASYRTDTQINETGPAYSGRETIYPNGSLLVQRVTLEDTGYYTLQVIDAEFQAEEVTGQLGVFPELPKPNITSNNSNPVEHKDPVVFRCESEIQNTTYLWLINIRSVQNSLKLELSKDNRTLTLFHVTRNDIGTYECELQNPATANRSDPLYLNVLYGPDSPTISPSDTHYRPGANLSLSCHAASNPPAQYSWLINGSLKQSSQELCITNITANDSGTYTCLVHNFVTGRNNAAVRIIKVSAENTSTGSSPWTIAGIMIGVLVGVVLAAALGCFLFLRRTRRASGMHDPREHRPPASAPGRDPSSTSTSPTPLPGPRTVVPIYEDLLNPNTDIYCRIDPKADVAS